MSNGDIVLFQSSDGVLHTISLLPEQLAELGLQVQYTTPSTSTEDTAMTSQIEQQELIQNNEMHEIEILKQNSVLTSNNVMPEVVDPQKNETMELETHTVPIHNVVRVSGLATKGGGFQLITDLIGKNPQPTKSLVNEINLNSSVDSNVIHARVLPQNNLHTNGVRNGSTLSGKFIITHNEMGTCKPDPKANIGKLKSILLQSNQAGTNLRTIDSASIKNHVVVQKIARKKFKLKNGTQLKAINSNIRKSLNIKAPLTPIPLAPKPPRAVLMQPDPLDATRWKPHKTVHVLQTGDQYQSVEKLNGEQLRVVTDALSNVVASPKTKNNVLYDPTSKTRIVYRVVYPEDLNLYSLNGDIEESKKAKRNLKPKLPSHATSPVTQVVSVTRSGRQVRPPRHMTEDYENNDEDRGPSLSATAGMEEGVQSGSLASLPPIAPNPQEKTPATGEEFPKARLMFGGANSQTPSLKKTLICPVCRKSYQGANRIGRHLSIFPDHAITARMMEILEKYKTQNQAKDLKPSVVKPKPVVVPKEQSIVNPTPPAVNVSKNDAETKILRSEDLESKDERNLFVSLVGIIERTSEECKAAVFVRQLAALIIKLKRLMPCLLFEDKNSSSCIISDSVGKMLDVSPGKYRLNMNAIKCLGEQGGNCAHIPVKADPPPIPVMPTTWMNNGISSNSEKTEVESGCTDQNTLDKWTTNVGKRKWIPIGTRDTDENSNTNDESWLSNNSEMLINNQSFTQTVEDLKSWDPLKKQSRVEKCTPSSPWQANIPELTKMDIKQDISAPSRIITSSNQPPVQSDDSITFDCPSKIVDMHPTLVFDMKRNMALDANDITLKTNLNCDPQSTCEESVGPENYDFNDSRFDLQIDSDKLNFTSAQYNEMKYGRDALPPFRKIEASKNLQLPVDALSDMSSDGDKLHLPSSDTILNDNNYQITSESLGLAMDNGHIDSLNVVESCKSVALNPSDNAVHCDHQTLLNASDLNLPISNTSTLSRNESMLSVSESSLDGSRLNLSSSLLLDPLGADCLSFGDSELRPTSQMSLDLQLDLFPFHHH